MINKKIPELFIPENSKKYQGEPICISGPPGIGKSTIGRKVAEKIDKNHQKTETFIYLVYITIYVM